MLQKGRKLKKFWFSGKHFFEPKKSQISKYFVSVWQMGQLANRPKLETNLWKKRGKIEKKM